MTNHHFMFSTLLGGSKLLAFGVVGLTAGMLSEVALGNHTVLTPDTHIPLGMAATLVISSITAAMWLSRVLTKLSDKIDAMDKRIDNLKCVRESECKVENDP